jgi:hypothetical protein
MQELVVAVRLLMPKAKPLSDFLLFFHVLNVVECSIVIVSMQYSICHFFVKGTLSAVYFINLIDLESDATPDLSHLRFCI